jgi:LacI family transcriptional regulator
LIVDALTPALVRQWVRTNRLEAVVSPGVLPLNAWGFNVPVKLGFASLHLWGKETEGLTGIDQESDGIAAAAVDMLVTLLHRNQRGVPSHPVCWMLRGRWVAGETTRQIRPLRVRSVGIENELLGIPSV